MVQANPNSKGIESIYPLSPLQEGILFHSVQEPDAGTYIVQYTAGVRGRLTLENLQRAWNDTVAAHHPLRASYVWETTAQPLQAIRDVVSSEVTFVDLQGIDKDEQRISLEKILGAERKAVTDLKSAPLARIAVARLRKNEYSFVFTYHHIILDGWSMYLLLDEVSIRYHDDCNDSNTRFADRPQFEEFVNWIEGQKTAEAENFWKSSLAGFNEPTTFESGLPPAPEIANDRYDEVELAISDALSHSVAEFARSNRITLATVLQGAWSLLLSRYANEQDVCFGSTMSVRPPSIDDVGSMIGLLINTLPLRVQVNPKEAISDWLQQLQKHSVDMQTYSSTALSDIQRWSDVPHGTALFDNIIVIENLPQQQAGQDRDRLEFIDSNLKSNTNFPFTLIVFPGETINFLAQFRCDVHEKGFVIDLLDQLEECLTSIVQDANAPVGSISISPQKQQTRLIESFGSKPEHVGSDQTIVDVFLEQCLSRPDAIAVCSGNNTLTYSELLRRATTLAHLLSQHNLERETLVAVCLERNNELIIAILATLLAGCAYVPLDPAYPKSRVDFITSDSECPIIITSSAFVDKVSTSGTHVVNIDSVDWSADQSTEALSEYRPKSTDTAYIIYTSGSTGNPKGVLVTHANVVRLFGATEQWFGFNSDDVWTMYHSYAFDFSVWEIWGALLYGGRLVIVPYWESRSPESFRELLKKESVTVLNQTPSAFKQLMQVESELDPGDVLALRSIIFGGEALDIGSLQPWITKYGDDCPQLVNMYGITETTVHVTYRRILEADVSNARGSLIGVPIPDLAVFILDEQQRLCPIGVPGEMYVGGQGVARGYLRRPELTQSRFLENVRVGNAAWRLYRSGDIARYVGLNEIEYIGRADNQVKINGFRIELGEIESAIRSFGGISDCAAMARSDEDGHHRLVAYFIGSASSELDTNDLRDYLEQQLPAHCVPRSFVQMDSFPLTGNGKLDYKALPAPQPAASVGSKLIIPPDGPIESALADVWRDVLGIDSVSVTDSFFNLGGDSILSIRAVSSLRREGFRITPKQLFESPTIRELAKIAVPNESTSKTRNEIPRGDLALTPVQRWFFDKAFSNINHWNQAFAFDIDDSVSGSDIHDALNAAIHHHAAFRLRFDERNGEWIQFYADKGEARVSTFQAAASVDLAKYVLDAQLSLDIKTGPLAAFVVLENVETNRRTLLMVAHHLIVDGVSWQILLEDIESGLRRGDGDHQLLPPTLPYGAWPQELNDYRQSEQHRESIRYWQSIFAGCTRDAPVLPIDFEGNVENLEKDAVMAHLQFSKQETENVMRVTPNYFRCSTNELLLTALSDVLAEWTGRNETIIDLEGHGRESIVADADTTRSIGWFTSMFPILLPFDSNVTVFENCQSVKRRMRELPNKGIDFGIARYMGDGVNIENASGAADTEPSAQLVFNYLGDLDQITAGSKVFSFSQLDTEPWRDPGSSRSHQIEISAFVQGGQLKMWWIFNEKIHSSQTVNALIEHFGRSIRQLFAQSHSGTVTQLSAIDFPLSKLTENELSRLTDDGATIENIYPVSPIQSLHLSLIESSPAMGVDQWYLQLCGNIDVRRLENAWNAVLQEHQLLRSSFVYKNVSKPHTLIHRAAKISIKVLDWRNCVLPGAEVELEDLLKSQRQRGLDVTVPPLTNLTLVRMSGDASVLIWTNHHLQLDGWSWPLVLAGVGKHYKNPDLSNAKQSHASPQYSDFVEWLEKLDRESDTDFWRQQMASFSLPTVVPGTNVGRRSGSSPDVEYEEIAIRLNESETTALNDLARDVDATLTNIIFANWSLILGATNDHTDIVFGAAFSGRPAELDDVEQIVGPFVNDLPVRVTLQQNDSISDLLGQLRDLQFELTQHQQTPLEQIQDCSGVSWRHRLFDSLVVVQNYLTGQIGNVFGNEVQVEDVVGDVRTNYPLTIVIAPGEELEATFIAQKGVVDVETLGTLAETFRTLLSVMPAQKDARLTEVQDLVPQDLRSRTRSREVSDVAAKNIGTDDLTTAERTLLEIWHDDFQMTELGLEQSWADLGVQSALILKVHERIASQFERNISIAKMYEFPTIRKLADFLDGNDGEELLSAAASRAQRARSAARKRRKRQSK